MTAFDKVMESRKVLVDQIINNIENGYFFWQQEAEWNSEALRPHNPVSGAKYRGANRIRLASAAIREQLRDPRWMTFHQIREKGYHLKKGSHGVLCEKYIFEKKIKDEEGKEEIVELTHPIIKTFYVFNADYIEGVPAYEVNQMRDEEMLQVANRVIESAECSFRELAIDKAFYQPSRDRICLPLRTSFKDEITFVKTTLHEMAHSTGHPARLNRDLSGSFGSESYAREELRAELGALLVESDLGIHLNAEHINDHSNYLLSWAAALKKDMNEFFRALADAEKIASYLVERYRDKTAEKATEVLVDIEREEEEPER